MLEILKYIFWIVAVIALVSSGWFVKILSGFASIISDGNLYFWQYLPWQFQILILGLVSVVLFLLVRVFTKE